MKLSFTVTLLFIGLFVLSFVLTLGMRRFAIAKAILDIPNHRSSHELPVPRGGGVSFVTCFLIFISCLAFKGLIDTALYWSFMSATLLVAGIGIFDDKYGLPSHWRLVGHFSVSAMMIYGVQGMLGLNFWGFTFPPGTMLNILTLVYLTWLLNLYNFMDGIDGIASLELISVCMGAVALYWLAGTSELIWLPLGLAVCVAGFLCWNFPPARIFMGDVGSGFLGLMVGVFSMQAARIDEHYFWAWLILLGVFVVDASFTLLRRLFQKLRVYEAHRTHAYQHATRLYGGHRPVTLAVLAINVFWLFPMALVAGLGYVSGLTALCVAYSPLVLLAVKYKAGVEEYTSPATLEAVS